MLRVIENGYAYVDKTRYVELLENENNRYQFFIRPRRFGKSLFLSILENYYDLSRKNKFESIFSELYLQRRGKSRRYSPCILRTIKNGNRFSCQKNFYYWYYPDHVARFIPLLFPKHISSLMKVASV